MAVPMVLLLLLLLTAAVAVWVWVRVRLLAEGLVLDSVLRFLALVTVVLAPVVVCVTSPCCLPRGLVAQGCSSHNNHNSSSHNSSSYSHNSSYSHSSHGAALILHLRFMNRRLLRCTAVHRHRLLVPLPRCRRPHSQLALQLHPLSCRLDRSLHRRRHRHQRQRRHCTGSSCPRQTQRRRRRQQRLQQRALTTRLAGRCRPDDCKRLCPPRLRLR